MRKVFCSFILTLFSAYVSFADGRYLVLSYPGSEIQMPFTKVNVIDLRNGNQSLGFVQVGGFNRTEPVLFNGNISDSIVRFFIAGDTTGKVNQELTIVLYELFLSEMTGGTSEVGRLKICMRFFSKSNQERFHELLLVDSIYKLNAGDATKKLLKSVSVHLSEIAKNSADCLLTSSDSLPHYTENELHYLDSLEKLNIPIYNTTVYKPGIFPDYEHFKANDPIPTTITIDSGNVDKIRVYEWDAKKKETNKISSKTVYAISDGHDLYKATSIGFYKLEKNNFDFYYVGKTSFVSSNNTASVAMWGLMFGIAGAAIAANSNKNQMLFKYKINYLRGNSIPLSLANE